MGKLIRFLDGRIEKGILNKWSKGFMKVSIGILWYLISSLLIYFATELVIIKISAGFSTILSVLGGTIASQIIDSYNPSNNKDLTYWFRIFILMFLLLISHIQYVPREKGE